MLKRTSWLMVLVVAVTAPPLAYGTWVFRPFPTSEGLSFEQIRDIKEAEDGSVWIGSWGEGVSRVNGVEWTTFDTSNGLSNDRVVCLELDRHGGVWVGTTDGLCYISNGRVTVFNTQNTPELPSNEIMSVCCLRNGDVWVGTLPGEIVAFRPNTPSDPRGRFPQDTGLGTIEETSGAPLDGVWSLVVDGDLTGGQKVYDIIEATDGSIWVAISTRGALRYDGQEWQLISEEDGVPGRIRTFYEDSESVIWAAGGEYLCRFEDGSWSAFKGPVTSVCESSLGQILVGTAAGLWQMEEGGYRELDFGRQVGSPEANVICPLRDGSLLLGTYEGLIRGSEPLWKSFSETAEGIGLAGVGLCVEPGRYLFSIDKEKRAAFFDGEEWRSTDRLLGEEDRFIMSTAPKSGRVWALYENFAVSYSVPEGTVLRKVPIPEIDQPRFLFQTSRGQLWLADRRKGLFELSSDGWRRIRSGRVKAIEEAGDGAFYVCFHDRVEHWEGEKVECLGDRHEELRDLPFTAICRTSEGQFWFGTYGGGAFYYDGATVTQHKVGNGPISDYIASIYEASDGTMWFSYRKRGMASYRDGRWVNFTHLHGLPNISAREICEYPNGTIWAAFRNSGLYRFKPDPEPPETFISGRPEVIPPSGNGFFSIGGIDSWDRTPRKDLEYSWRIVPRTLTDSVSGWSDYSRETTVHTHRLTPGDYLFQVRAVDEDRNVDPTPASAEVRVALPLWQRKEFFVPLALAVLVATVSLIAGYRKHLGLKHSEKELRKHRSRLEEAQRITRLGNWEWEAATHNLFVSDELRSLFGLSPRTSKLSVTKLLRLIHPEQRSGVLQAYRALLRGEKTLDIEHCITLPDGTTKTVHQRAEVVTNPEGNLVVVVGTVHDITRRKQAEGERERLIEELSEALAEVKKLSGLLPICSNCKKVRDDDGYWTQIESYLSEHSEASFSHGICPDCATQLYPDYYEKS